MNGISGRMIDQNQNKKAVKKKRIMEAASLLFAKMHYHEVMVDEVAKIAEIAKGTVYNYFSSKEQLYFAIMKEKLQKLTSSLKDEIEHELNSIDALETFIHYLYSFMVSNSEFFFIYQKDNLKASNEFCEEVAHLEGELKSILIEIVRNGKDENLFRSVDEKFAVELILGSIFGAVQEGIDHGSQSYKINEAAEFILNGLTSIYSDANQLPLSGKTLVITRTVEQSKESSEVFIKLGAKVIIFPTLDIVPPSNWNYFDKIIHEREKINFIIFTSAHSVKMFAKRCEDLNVNFDFTSVKVVAVGSKTALICKNLGIPVHIIPKKFSSEGVVDELSSFKLKGKNIFIPRSAIGREELPAGLEELGASLLTAPVYNVSLPSEAAISRHQKKLEKGRPDLFIFTSPSTFKNFLEIQKIKEPVEYFKGYDVAAIGPATKSAIENRDVKVNILPEEFTIEGLANAIIQYYKKEKV